MKSTIRIILVSAVVGAAVGAVLAGWQARPWDVSAVGQQDAEHAAGTTSDSAHPRAKIEETVFNFGTMEYGTAMSHAFLVQNLGDGMLQVEVGSTTCKCTVGDLTSNRIAPGAEAEVNLEWEAKSAPGPFRHGATLLTNDPEKSRIELIVEGTVVESTSMEPSQLFFGSVQAGETKQAQIYLMAFLQDKIRIESHHLGDEQMADEIQVKIEPCELDELPNPEARAGVCVSAVLHAGHTLGPIHQWLTIEANFEDSGAGGEEIKDGMRKFNIPIVANVIGDMSIFGPGLVAKQGLLKMGTIESDQGKISRLIIVIRGDHASTTELKIASAKPKELRASLGQRRVMGEHLVHVPLMVEVPVGTRAMTRRGEAFDEVSEIVISTNHPETPELKLRVVFSVLL
jgi:uncharacterized protein DUF1573